MLLEGLYNLGILKIMCGVKQAMHMKFGWKTSGSETSELYTYTEERKSIWIIDKY
jgi:hypothetical protein